MNDYQCKALQVGYNGDYVDYTAGLLDRSCELGEVVRLVIDSEHDAHRGRVAERLGDILWHVAVLADSFGLQLEDVASFNVARLTEP